MFRQRPVSCACTASDSCHAGSSGGLGHGLGHGGTYPLVKGGGDDVVGAELLLGDKTGQSLVGRASRTVMPSKAHKEVRKVGKEYVATYVEVDTDSLTTEVRKGARGYVGFIRYSEHVYECRGASKSAALSAPCEKIKTRNLNEMIRHDGKKWQY